MTDAFAEPMDTYELVENEIREWVWNAKFETAIPHCEAALAALPQTEYHAVIGRSWRHRVDETAGWLAAFYQSACDVMPVEALYGEMNRFEVNPDRWYLDSFAYETPLDSQQGHVDWDWLCGWKKSTADTERFVLDGFADLQALFARDYGEDEPPGDLRAASELTILLLTVRMQDLVHAAVGLARQRGKLPQDLPVLSAAHDSGMFCVSRPS
ncbi:MAG: hypothetical protein KY475_22655 [Planctomycetes bacterium]|nr:hypothetical protein [Planctomycetota bacterium]